MTYGQSWSEKNQNWRCGDELGLAQGIEAIGDQPKWRWIVSSVNLSWKARATHKV